MASFLQKTTNPWIENAFVYASSYDPNAFDGDGIDNDDGGGDGDAGHADGRAASASGAGKGNGRNGDVDDDSDAHLFDSQYEPEPQTQNTIPSGLIDSQEDDFNNSGIGGAASAAVGGVGIAMRPPSRQSKIAQVIRREGDFDYYDRDHAEEDATADSSPTSSSCPPYLILSDGKYSAIAFLSPETLASMDNNTPPANRALITITHYTVSTVLQCTSSVFYDASTNEASMVPNRPVHSQILKNIFDSSLIPRQYQTTLKANLDNPRLFMCLYIQGPIVTIGAENQGLIGTPIDVHCSVTLRKMLMDHETEIQLMLEHERASGEVEGSYDDSEGEGISHSRLILRLEACHLNYQWEAKKKEQRERRQQRLEKPPSTAGSTLSPAGKGGRRRKQYGRRAKQTMNDKSKQQKNMDVEDDDDSEDDANEDNVNSNIPPDWPWESRLDSPMEEDNAIAEDDDHDATNAAATNNIPTNAILVPGNVQCLIKQEDEDQGTQYQQQQQQQQVQSLEDVFGADYEQRLLDTMDEDNTAAAVNKSKEGENNQFSSTPGDRSNNDSPQVSSSSGGERDKFYTPEEGNSANEEGEQEQVNVNVGTNQGGDGDSEEDDDATVPLEDVQNQSTNQGDTSSKAATPSSIQCGNVQELLENFEEIDNVLDLDDLEGTQQSPVDEDDGSLPDTVADVRQQKQSSAKQASTDNVAATTAKSSSEEVSKRSRAATASFVGIDDMIVNDESEDDDGGKEDEDVDFNNNGNDMEEAEESDGNNQPFHDGQEEEREGEAVTFNAESQIPIVLKKAKRRPAAEQEIGTAEQENEDEENYGPQSQLPLVIRKAANNKTDNRRPSGHKDNPESQIQSQIPLATTKTKKSKKKKKKKRRPRAEEEADETCGAEFEIPISMRKDPPETLGQQQQNNKENKKDYGRESQLPIVIQQAVQQADENEREEDVGVQPLSPRRGMVQQSDIKDSSDEEWMRVHPSAAPGGKKTKKKRLEKGTSPSPASKRRRKKKIPAATGSPSRSKPTVDIATAGNDDEENGSLHDDELNGQLSESQMAAGEGSEETLPPPMQPQQKEDMGVDEQALAVAGHEEEVEEEDVVDFHGGDDQPFSDDGIHEEGDDLSEKEESLRRQQPKNLGNTAQGDSDHQLDISMENSDADVPTRTKTRPASVTAHTINIEEEEDRGASKDNSQIDTKQSKKDRRKRRKDDDVQFDMARLLKRAKRLSRF